MSREFKDTLHTSNTISRVYRNLTKESLFAHNFTIFVIDQAKRSLSFTRMSVCLSVVTATHAFTIVKKFEINVLGKKVELRNCKVFFKIPSRFKMVAVL